MIGFNPTALPGLTDLPVYYGTAQNPVNNMYPRPLDFQGVNYYNAARPGWPTGSYAWTHAPVGGLLGATAPSMVGVTFPQAIVMMGGSYLGYVAALYVLNKAWKLDLQPWHYWVGGAIAMAIHYIPTAAAVLLAKQSMKGPQTQQQQ